MRILVVEDDPTLCAQLVSAVAGAGHTVESASDGATAHYLGEVEDFDAVVLDLGLPTLDGLSVMRRWPARPAATPGRTHQCAMAMRDDSARYAPSPRTGGRLASATDQP